ncbi:hypothetical protein VIGAN_02000400 [Vigna angularis var. angularis]|uniref:Uncharacterized protein n=1 Tax=Vigna angularis var. angularis TaxID=157739 RepID=A0A0S3RAD5_PHAAN|nr:hypothetical protein VIGAN_02000400 [Vigna angularis var. angularis]
MAGQGYITTKITFPSNMMMKITSLYTCNNNQVLNVLINLWCVNSRKFFMASNRVLDTGSKDYNQHCSVLVSSQAIEILQILSTKPKNNEIYGD